jgi:hypothetical protein
LSFNVVNGSEIRYLIYIERRDVVMTGKDKAIKDMKDMIAQYKWTHDRDAEMLAMYKEDRDDFRSINKLIKEEKWKEAREKSWYLDTAARENIPQSTWDFMDDMYKAFVKM